MVDTEIYYGWCCSDCLMLIANGETPPEMSEEETNAWLEKINSRTTGFHVGYGGQHEEDCPNLDNGQWVGESDCYCEDIEFSWNRCDHCGSGLGGSRHAFHMWEAK